MSVILIENQECVICLDNQGEILRKNGEFGCNCAIYFHQDCWNTFQSKKPVICPFCKKVVAEDVHAVVIEEHARSMREQFVKLFLYISVFLVIVVFFASYILYLVGAILLSPKAENYGGIMHICVGTFCLWSLVLLIGFLIIYENSYPWMRRLNNWSTRIIQPITNAYSLILGVFGQIRLWKGEFDDHPVIMAAAITNLIFIVGGCVFLISLSLLRTELVMRS